MSFGILLLILFYFHKLTLALNTTDENIDQFITDYFKYYQIKTASIFSCQTKDILHIVKHLIPYDIQFTLISLENINFLQLNNLLNAKYQPIGILLDNSCEKANQLLDQASIDESLFNEMHHWLLIGLIIDRITRIEIPSLKAVRLDSRVISISSQPGNFPRLRDLFRIGGTQQDLFDIQLQWTPGQLGFRALEQRKNFQDTRFQSAVVVVEDPWEHWQDLRYRHLNPAAKLGFTLLTIFAEIHNFTIGLIELDSWGYTKVNGTYGGMIGLLQTKHIEFGTALLMKDYRLDYCDFTSHFHQFQPRFIFRRPPISATQNIYLLTFSKEVWYCFGVITLLGAFTLCLTEYLGDKSQPFEDHDRWLDYIFTALATIFQQGTTSSPNKISSRIVFWCLLLLAVMYDNSYSASIVVLLQASDNLIKTIPDLIASPFKLKMQNLEYNTHFVNITRSSIIKKLYWKKIFTQPWNEAFVDLEKGVAAMRKGMVAYYCDVGSNKYISDTFEEHEKCELEEILMNPPEGVFIPLQKGSPYKEYFSKDLLLLREVGIMDRWHNYWYEKFPKCQNEQSHGFASVSIQDFHPAIAIFFFGVIASILFLLVEIFYMRFLIKRNQNK